MLVWIRFATRLLSNATLKRTPRKARYDEEASMVFARISNRDRESWVSQAHPETKSISLLPIRPDELASSANLGEENLWLNRSLLEARVAQFRNECMGMVLWMSLHSGNPRRPSGLRDDHMPNQYGRTASILDVESHDGRLDPCVSKLDPSDARPRIVQFVVDNVGSK